MTALERRLRTFAFGEWFCAVFLPYLAIVVVGRDAWTAANVVGAVALAGILIVGGTYWWLKLRQVRARADQPAGLAGFAVYRWLGWVLPAAGAVVALTQWGEPWRASPTGSGSDATASDDPGSPTISRAAELHHPSPDPSSRQQEGRRAIWGRIVKFHAT